MTAADDPTDGARLLTPTDVADLLDRYGLAPRRSAGQNFVADPNTVRKIVRDAGIGEQDTVVEIGPGLGSLTLGLAAAARKVVAVEVDAGMVRALSDVLAAVENVEVVHADALDLDLAGVVDTHPVKVVANLPYNIATPLVFRLLDVDAVSELYVMVQREVGGRWGASPGDDLYSGVSIKLQLRAQVDVAASVPRQVFTPVPNVDSVMVRLRRRDRLDPASYGRVARLVDAAFLQRRKTLRRSLREIATVSALDAAFDTAGVDPAARPETLTPTQFVTLADALSHVP